jgi:hypothetical protein
VINETPLTLSARAGAADAPTGARWPFQLQAQSGDTRIELNGSAPAPFATTGLDAKLQVQGPTRYRSGKSPGSMGCRRGPFSSRRPELGRQDLSGQWDQRIIASACPTRAADHQRW